MELIKSIQGKRFSDIKDYCNDKIKSIATNLIETRKNAYLESLKSPIVEKEYEEKMEDEDEDNDENGEDDDEKSEKKKDNKKEY